MNKLIIIAAVVAATALSSCKTPKETSATSGTTESPALSISGDQNPEQFRSAVSALSARYGAWTDVKMPLSIDLKAPSRFSCTANVTMKRDRWIYMSIRKFGFEGAALMITADSIFAYEKIGKRYISESLKKLLKGFPATVGNLQDMLLGRPFVPGKGSLMPGDVGYFSYLRISDPDLPDAWMMRSNVVGGDDGQFSMIIDSTKNPLLQAFFVEAGSTIGTLLYTDMRKMSAGTVASDLALDIKAGSRNVEASMSWNTDKARWNSNASVEWRLPRGYSRIEASQIVKILSSL